MIWRSGTDAVGEPERARRRRAAVSLSGLLCTAAIAGCGGGGAGSPSSSGSGPKGQPTGSAAATTSAAGAASAQTTGSAPGAATASQASGAARSSPSQVRLQADAICVRRNRELKGVPQGGESLAGTASAVSRRVAIEQRAVAELSALSPPPESAGDWRTMIEQTKLALAEATKLASAARSGNAAAVTHDLTRSSVPDLRLLAAAARADVRHCTGVN